MEHAFDTKQGRDWLKGLLSNSVVTVTFTKTDGTERVMKCTLKQEEIIASEKKTDRTKVVNEEVINVWDVEKGGWRSFRLDSITQVQASL